MIRYGYDHRRRWIIVASGTLAQLIPPSLVLIVLASQTRGVSVGVLFRRGHRFWGLMLAAMYALYVVYVAIRYPEKAPALPLEQRQARAPPSSASW